MLRGVAVLSALGLLALVITASLNTDGNGLAGLFRSSGEPLVDAGTGEPLTLETVQREAEWRRETARKLRDLK